MEVKKEQYLIVLKMKKCKMLRRNERGLDVMMKYERPEKKLKKAKIKTKKYKQQLAFSLKSMVTSPIHLCNTVCGLRCTLVVYIPPLRYASNYEHV